MGYIVTNTDRLAMIELLNTTWNVDFKASSERDSSFTKWTIQAPNPQDKTYYTTDGASIAEAINKWYSKLDNVNALPIKREVWNGIWDSKAELIKEEE